MATKFDKAVLLEKLQAKRQSLLDAAEIQTQKNQIAFDEWKAKNITSLENELVMARQEIFGGDHSGNYNHYRPVPVLPNQKMLADIERSIRELECVHEDVVQLNSTSSILALI